MQEKLENIYIYICVDFGFCELVIGPKTHCGAYCSDIVFFYKADTPKGPYISFNQKNECLWLFPDVSTELPREHYLLMSAQLGCLVIF